MDSRALHATRLFAAVVFLGSTVVLAVQLINPSPVVVTVGENGTEVAELGGYFRYPEVAVVAVAACALGASGTFLLLGDRSTDAAADARLDDVDTTPPDRTPVPDGSSDLEPSGELLEARRREWEETADRLANNEREIYETLLDADGVLPQSDVVDRTDLSKATVSRELDSLETKNLVERKRRGMGNVVLLC
ncbi:helix-turn-helix transcriptional regulator [Halorientalis halophila]|uniref:helix-turn-helix transcriptional regulator n=1 Tax=Halorientalis halophila TaxID=3108499 RepID=UPI00300983CC